MESLLRTFGLELSTFFLVGLFAELHCLGMCGPLVSLYANAHDSDKSGRISWSQLRRHFSYHGFRVGSYALLGVVFGVLGAVFVNPEFLAGSFRSIRGVVGILAGILIGVYGLSYLVRGSTASGIDRYFGQLGGRLFRSVKTLFPDNQTDSETRPSSLRGSLHAVLPCPILYPAFLYVLARGSATFGFLAMLTLGLGTVPLLLLQGLLAETETRSLPVMVHRLVGVLLVALAYVTLSMGLRNLGISVPMVDLPYYQPFQP